jgi:phospholipid/cholesterol/gamma-HCH transport system ATP-binding protein
MKQRDVSHTSSLVVTHRLQDAFILATHRFNRTTNQMETLPPHQTDPNTSFLMLNRGRLAFDGTTAELIHSEDPFIKEYIS